MEPISSSLRRSREPIIDDQLHVGAAAGSPTPDAATALAIGGTSGNDVLSGTSSADTISGLGGNDTLNGLGGNDTLDGGSGNDSLNGGSGADSMIGGTGNDSYTVDNSGDVVVESSSTGGTDTVTSSVSFTLGSNVENLILSGSGNINGTGNTLANQLTGNVGANRLVGSSGNDSLSGSDGNDTLDGGSGDDSLHGGSGADSMIGGSGNDSYTVGNSGDRVVETSSTGGTDTVTSSVSFTLGSNVENLILSGAGNINGTGNSLGNSLEGNDGANRLSGGSGDDVLFDILGNDTFIGGTGDDLMMDDSDSPDTYVFSLAASAGADFIEDRGGLTLRFEDVVDADGNSVLNLADLNAAIASVADDTQDVRISFKNGASILLADYGIGTTDSIDDILGPGTQIVITG